MQHSRKTKSIQKLHQGSKSNSVITKVTPIYIYLSKLAYTCLEMKQTSCSRQCHIMMLCHDSQQERMELKLGAGVQETVARLQWVSGVRRSHLSGQIVVTGDNHVRSDTGT